MSTASQNSAWRLAAMLLAILCCAMALMMWLTSWTLSQTFQQVGRAIIADDLDEYSQLYEKDGALAVKDLFTAGEHQHDQMVRILAADGSVLVEGVTEANPHMQWPTGTQLGEQPQPGHTVWYTLPAEHGESLTFGRARLRDGGELWFGRTDAADLQAIRRVHFTIVATMAFTALLALAPIGWFVVKVLRPVRQLITATHGLASPTTLHERLPTQQSIPELQEFAQAFNASLDRVQSLTEELEAANDQLAHELRTPLARVRGNVEHCLIHTQEPSSREHAARAVEEIDRATQLIHTILSVRAGDARSMKLQLQPRDLGQLVQGLGELYQGAADSAKLSLTWNTEGSPRTSQLDAQRIQQALCNLLDNALAYTPAGGSITLTTRYLLDQVQVQVADTGPGLQGDDAERIWRRFMRGSAASATTPGIGLGLSLVQAILHAHGGTVTAQNRPTGGAEFVISLPG